MGKIHKADPNRAYDNEVKCRFILDTLNANLDEQLYGCFKKSKSIEELDKRIENLLEEYYAFANNVIDYYGVEDN